MTDLLLRIAALAALFASIVLVIQLGLNRVLTRTEERRAIGKRLDLLRQGETGQQATSLLRADMVAPVEGHSLYARLYGLVARAKVPIAPRVAIQAMVGATAAIAVLLLVLANGMGKPITGGVVLLLLTFSVALGLGLPLSLLSRRAQKRRKQMEEQFPIAMEIFTRALRAGHPITAAMTLLVTEMENPIAGEFGLVADEVAYGADLGEALARLSRRWDLPDLKMFSVCLAVQSETGGNLAEILTNLTGVIRDRAALYLKVRALSSEGRISALILSVLPVLTFVVLFLINPGFYLDVAADPIFINGFIAFLGVYTVGVLWIRRMVDLKV
ncbi:type II secretion system F family protein [Novosphingobium sp. KCTC 2891]|uniref:type II secretion system F family protein n=1 Tax=Novosphingobium sp. KCTC 2891 TaxID=2989730 RepID=UPI002221CD29|nr:type II secretion system F family protein [Novosphingobium sp. KCTC 2891]MCW1381603.1 type II secretion system F family protein [Novosphingobium sp. KCTC 2891]